MSFKSMLADLDGRTLVATVLTVAYAGVLIYACAKGYVEQALQSVGTFISAIVSFYFATKTMERR